MKKAILIFLITIPIIVKCQTNSPEYILVPYDSVFNSRRDMTGGSCPGCPTEEELRAWQPTSSDTMAVVSLNTVAMDDLFEYFPMKLLPSGEMVTITDFHLWSLNFFGKKPYFLFKAFPLDKMEKK